MLSWRNKCKKNKNKTYVICKTKTVTLLNVYFVCREEKLSMTRSRCRGFVCRSWHVFLNINRNSSQAMSLGEEGFALGLTRWQRKYHDSRFVYVWWMLDSHTIAGSDQDPGHCARLIICFYITAGRSYAKIITHPGRVISWLNTHMENIVAVIESRWNYRRLQGK